jgi:hypothetical protein
MPTLIRILLLVIIAISITACATTSVQKSYINLRQPETLIEESTKKEFEVLSGDSLKILETKSCPEGKGVCWKVSSVKTGKVGFVNADLMQERQDVYIEENKRTFANGTFQSKYPKVTININPEYRYAGFISEMKDVMSVGGSRELYIKNERYMFVYPFNYKKDNGEEENTKSIKTEVTKTFIKILKFDKIYLGGEVLYTVNPGDTLEKLYSKICLDGYGECWGVRNLKDGQVGIISASRAKLNHQIYYEKDIQTQNLPIKKDEYRLKSGITITFRTVETFFSGELFSKVKNRLYAGVEQHADKNYQYFIRKSYPSMKGSVTRYLYEKGGYVVPLCLLQKGIGRVAGARQDMMILIHYYEELSEHGFSCSAFPINGKFLNDEEIKFIEEFNERAKLAFEIVYSQ